MRGSPVHHRQPRAPKRRSPTASRPAVTCAAPAAAGRAGRQDVLRGDGRAAGRLHHVLGAEVFLQLRAAHHRHPLPLQRHPGTPRFTEARGALSVPGGPCPPAGRQSCRTSAPTLLRSSGARARAERAGAAGRVLGRAVPGHQDHPRRQLAALPAAVHDHALVPKLHQRALHLLGRRHAGKAPPSPPAAPPPPPPPARRPRAWAPAPSAGERAPPPGARAAQQPRTRRHRPGPAQVLRSFTGADYAGFNATVPPGASLVEPGATPSEPVTLAWSTFREMAIQAGARRAACAAPPATARRSRGVATHRAGRLSACRGARLRVRRRSGAGAACCRRPASR